MKERPRCGEVRPAVARTRLAKSQRARHPVTMLQSASVIGKPMRRGLALALLAAVACSAGNDTHAEQHPFSDGQGRTCRATLEKASPNAASVGESVSCEGETKQCSAESTPCFQLSIDATSGAVLNCPACCKGTASSFVSSDCSAIVCETDPDCVYTRAQCLNGACTCPNGVCE